MGVHELGTRCVKTHWAEIDVRGERPLVVTYWTPCVVYLNGDAMTGGIGHIPIAWAR